MSLSDRQIEAKITARNAARNRRDAAEADRIAAELSKQGIVLEDSPSGTRWKRAPARHRSP